VVAAVAVEVSVWALVTAEEAFKAVDAVEEGLPLAVAAGTELGKMVAAECAASLTS
jgi:hypothetical protein